MRTGWMGLWVVVALWTGPGLGQEEVTFDQYRVYGITSPALHSQQEAIQWAIDQQDGARGLTEHGRQELQRYLNYNLLSHYIGFYLNLVEQPGVAYLQGLEPLRQQVGEGFEEMVRIADSVAGKLAKELRFSLTLIRLSTKHIQNGPPDAGAPADLTQMHQRLEQISQQLQHNYPDSRGELPPVLIAFVSSFFLFENTGIPVSCKNPLPGQLKSKVLESL